MKQKILIVDDEPDLLMYLKTFLEDQGYEVSCAEDVQSALQMFSGEKPDLVCLDIMMPIKSGISFYDHLRRNGCSREIPVIIISGLSEESLIAETAKVFGFTRSGKKIRKNIRDIYKKMLRERKLVLNEESVTIP